jgi:cytochrome d ubiquinol oxidase subunit I
MQRLSHTLFASWQAGAFLVLSVSAYYLLRGRHRAFAEGSMKIALVIAMAASLLQLVTGHWSAVGVSEHQPAKLAAMEAHFDASAPAGLYVLGWVDADGERVFPNAAIPGGLSFLVHGDRGAPITGLNAFAPEDRPPVNPVFQSYHLMVAIGMTLIALSLVGGFYWWRGRLFETRWLLVLFLFSVLGPQLANQAGWFTAEVGRQPWVVYELLRTEDAFSPNVDGGQVLASLAMFVAIYGLLFVLFVFLLDQKIRVGPDAPTPTAEGGRA